MSADGHLALLADYLSSGHQVATRLSASLARIAPLLPLDGVSVGHLGDDEKERLDAFLFRFSSLAAIVQDHVGRAVLLAEEEDLSRLSRKDQRLLLEKLGALDQDLAFGTIAELRNRLAHSYPDDPNRQAEVMNLAAQKATALLAAFNHRLAYASKFGVGTTLRAIQLPADPKMAKP
jgi:hypothetical protein